MRRLWWILGLVGYALPVCSETLAERIATLSDQLGLVLVVDGEINLARPVARRSPAIADTRSLQIELARFGLYAQPVEPRVWRVKADPSSQTIQIQSVHVQNPTPDVAPESPRSPRVFQPRMLARGPAQVLDQDLQLRLRGIPNLFLVGELVALRGVTLGSEEPQFGLTEHGLPISPTRLTAPTRAGPLPPWLQATSGPDSALRGPNALGGWLETGDESAQPVPTLVELRMNAGGLHLARGLWAPWRGEAGQLSVSGHAARSTENQIRTAGSALSAAADKGADVLLDYRDLGGRWDSQTFLTAYAQDQGYPWLILGPDQTNDPGQRRSTLDYAGDIDTRGQGLRQRTRWYGDGWQAHVDLGWQASDRIESLQLPVLGTDETRSRDTRWSRLTASLQRPREDRPPAGLQLQFVPRTVERTLRNRLTPGTPQLPWASDDSVEVKGSVYDRDAANEDLESWLITYEDSLRLASRWRLDLRAGWAWERIETELSHSRTTDGDCQILTQQGAQRSCAADYPDTLSSQTSALSSQFALPAVALVYSGARLTQSLQWRRGYGRSRAALDLFSGEYRVYAPERIDAVEFSVHASDPIPSWRLDLFAYRWLDRRLIRRNFGGVGSLVLDASQDSGVWAHGAELSVQQGGEHWAASASVGWLDARYRQRNAGSLDIDGNRLEDAPRYTASLQGRAQSSTGWFGEFSAQFAGRTFLDATNTADATRPAMRLLDASVGRRLGDWEIFLYARNVVDGGAYETVIPRSGLSELGSSYKIVDGPSAGLGVRWQSPR